MKRISLLILTLTLSASVSLSQSNSYDSLNSIKLISIHSKKNLQRIDMGLLARSYLLRLKTHPKIDLNKEEYETYMMIMDSLQGKEYTLIDSMTITLKSGLSWNMAGPLPQEPKNFYFTLLIKKDRQKKEVQEYIQFSTFANAWKERGDLPYEMVERLSRYFAVIFEEKKVIEMYYELKYKSINSTEITKREITFDKQFDED